MKRTSVGLIGLLLVAVVLAVAAPVSAHDYDRDDSDNPWRLVAYWLHPLGYGLETAITRPVHWAVSQPYMRVIFGHDPRFERNEHYHTPNCNLCRPTPTLQNCPKCNRPILKMRDDYIDDRIPYFETLLP